MSPALEKDGTKLFIVEQELKFARCLSGNDPAKRNKILKNLKKWLKTRAKSSHAFSDEDFLRLWKGLFYCMWMSDKPLVQESLSEQLASLVHLFDDPKISMQFFKVFLKTMCLEWFGIDQWRIDKFLMLVRRFIRQAFFVLRNNEWADELIDLFVVAIETTVLDTETAPLCSLTMHFNDVVLEELGKVAEGQLPEEAAHKFIQPFVSFMARTDDYRLAMNMKKSIFQHLLYQSEFGQEYQEKYEIWKKAGFPTENIDDIEVEVEYENGTDEDESDAESEILTPVENKKMKTKKQKQRKAQEENASDEEDEDAEEEKAYDVRAGRVNVVVEEIKFDANKVVEMFNKIKYTRFANHKNKRVIKKIVDDYKKFASGTFPIGYTKMPTVKKPTKLEGQLISDPDLCAMEMDEFEKSLLQRSTKLSAKQKRKLAQMREEEKRLMEDDEESPKKRKLNSDDSDEENKEIDENASGPLIKFVKGDNLSESKKVNSKMSKANVEWTEEDTNDDIVLSQESSSSEDESSEIAEAIVKKTVKKLKKRNSLPAMSSTHQNGVFSTHDEWSEPMREGETEYFVPSRKQAVKKANEKTEAASQVVTPANEKKAKLVKNPFANKLLGKGSTPTVTPTSSVKRVKIMLHQNTKQSKAEYFAQLKNSPQIPFDPTKKPDKGLLKPNLVPSPINPFYKRKLKLNFNDTL